MAVLVRAASVRSRATGGGHALLRAGSGESFVRYAQLRTPYLRESLRKMLLQVSLEKLGKGTKALPPFRFCGEIWSGPREKCET